MTRHSRLSAPGLADEYDVLQFALDTLNNGKKVALATIVKIEGPFSRPLGAQLAIDECGSFLGSISGGCLEQALVEEGIRCLKSGEPALLRYGVGSPFIDVRLPCGGTLDLLVEPRVTAATLTSALALQNERTPFGIRFGLDGDASSPRLLSGGEEGGATDFVRIYRPRLRLILAGRGWEIVALSELASRSGAEVVVASHEAETLAYCKPYVADTIQLKTPAAVPELQIDASTGVACLFHEHEWEVNLLRRALESPAFYVGALGSRATQEERLRLLRSAGVEERMLTRLKAPIGLFASFEPTALAASVLAEVLETWARNKETVSLNA